MKSSPQPEICLNFLKNNHKIVKLELKVAQKLHPLNRHLCLGGGVGLVLLGGEGVAVGVVRVAVEQEVGRAGALERGS